MKPHKDLPGGSQAWASEVDALMEENKHLREVVRQLAANAGIDFANPKRGINAGDTPSVKNPVGQKLSSFADVSTYNVADSQVLTWNHAAQRWNPQTPTGGSIPIPVAYSLGDTATGFGQIDEVSTTWAYNATNETGQWEAGGSKSVTLVAGQWTLGGGTLMTLEMVQQTAGSPEINLRLEDYDSGKTAEVQLIQKGVYIYAGHLRPPNCTTASRPTGLGSGTTDKGAMVYDTTLGIPIWWNGTVWTDALGTTV